MILPDVNVLVYALRPDSANHTQCLRWLTGVLESNAPYGISAQVLASVVRVATNRRIFENPEPLETALLFVEKVMDEANCQLIEPGPDHWRIFCELCRRSKAEGNLVQDAWFAALAIESGCEWITFDRDYARFEGLRWRMPL
ncbi:MAG TPA: type II toxin-antitoxin system VapC family toxin [Candidatus Acidoferrales bacterium]|nr:type II toxin-antitoxin system VapC family toxin [Candidatus Acidoferrales bacterium]